MNGTDAVASTIHALYESISGPAGKEPDWARFASLLFPGAHLIRTTVAPDGTSQAKVMDVQRYIEDTTEHLRLNSFYEVEIACRIDRFGNIAHAFSTYESRHHPDDVNPIKRGINSIQLFNDGSRWYVVNVLWDSEREGLPIPETYLPR